MERHVPRGGGNSLKPSHNHGLWQVGMFNNLALWGEKKFLSELCELRNFREGLIIDWIVTLTKLEYYQKNTVLLQVTTCVAPLAMT